MISLNSLPIGYNMHQMSLSSSHTKSILSMRETYVPDDRYSFFIFKVERSNGSVLPAVVDDFKERERVCVCVIFHAHIELKLP